MMKKLKLSLLVLAFVILSACAQMNSSLVAPKGIASNDPEYQPFRVFQVRLHTAGISLN
ncbi:MAG: hypothetical protein K2Q13_10910 [Nitrosomonas sp.]|uniref:hypothetical protein n=1 Tax=Nitrosomonas sp. TaxID=42353 RepID=UPI0025F6EDEA|nr:hypothetical protein [Nitrosomonas sp.]MBY0475553.1 hypothetical protein [Nitrosomonas sp.]